MTRPSQKQSERETLHAVLAALGLRPDRAPEEGEAPDFTIAVAGQRIGVEITMYQSGDTVEDGREPELADINVGLMFPTATFCCTPGSRS